MQWVTQIYQDGVLLRGQLFEQLFVWRIIGGWTGGDRLLEQVLLGEELPDLSSVLPRHPCKAVEQDLAWLQVPG